MSTQDLDEGALPRATYRLQLHAGFGLDAVEAQVAYLDELGISHVYTSPLLEARAGSLHGYDLVNHQRLNPELGEEADLERLAGVLGERGMGLVADLVPNHMGVGKDDNPWWLDVLEWGRYSKYADHFDIDWTPAKKELRDQVLLPFLGDHYGAILESGDLKLGFDPERGRFHVRYWEHLFPIQARHTGLVLEETVESRRGEMNEEAAHALAREVATLSGLPEAPGSPAEAEDLRGRAAAAQARLGALYAEDASVRRVVDEAVARHHAGEEPANLRRLHRVLEAQAYRLAYWRVAADEINYRRFFDINELAGVRVELDHVFSASHAKVLEWLRAGWVTGLRIDHVDGLYAPKAYLERLRAEVGEQPMYLVVEKILAEHENLPQDWPVQGTTGYEVANQLNGLFVNADAERTMTRLYRRFAHAEPDFSAVEHAAKKHVIENVLSSELQVLAGMLNRVSEASWHTRDITFHGLRTALEAVAVAFPVYRTYVDDEGPSDQDRQNIAWAVRRAARDNPAIDVSVFDYIEAAATTDLTDRPEQGFSPYEVVRFARKLQQYTGPLMAKAVEDTAFYRHHRLISLNEVGGHPQRFGVSTQAFHVMNQQRAQHWPHTMTTVSTHDAKRGADVRMRIDVLSELSTEWSHRLTRWRRINRSRTREIDGGTVPSPNDMYLLYQTLVGSWPLELMDADDEAALSTYRERVQGYMMKALREAKQDTAWDRPHEEYEQAVSDFIGRILDGSRPNKFVEDFQPFARQVAELGALNGLAQVLLHHLGPGVPDVYQGTELWDLSLVDPDNRRPVDFDLRRRLLGDVRARAEAPPVEEWLESWPDARVKLYFVWRALSLRRAHPELFASRSYQPLEVRGRAARHVVAFLRERAGVRVVVVVPRLLATLTGGEGRRATDPELWGDTMVCLPAGEPTPLVDALGGQALTPRLEGEDPVLDVRDVFRRIPYGVLESR